LRGVEYVKILNEFGLSALKFSLGQICLNKRFDNRCVFQYRRGLEWLCGLQKDKSISCKLWPFVVFTRPKYGRASESTYKYHESKYYIYVYPQCQGLTYCCSSPHLLRVLSEVIEIWDGMRKDQFYSTSRTLSSSSPVLPIPRLSLPEARP